MGKRCLKIGHRGANGYCKGNTLLSFGRAIELDCDMIELDVHFKDNNLWVVHSMKDLDSDNPTLKQVIDFVNRRVRINIELKGRGAAKPVADLLKKYIKKGWNKYDFLVSSVGFKELKDFQKQRLGIKTGLIMRRRKRIAKGADFYSVNPALRIASKRFINKLHGRGFKVFVWTVNKKRDIDKLISLGVDGIISDYPDRI
jgi:glycerophosphoryl diester phosphodiesterase